MNKHKQVLKLHNVNERGAANGLVLSLIVSVVLLIAALGFGAWAYSGRQDYKNNVASKVSVAVAAAKTQQTNADAATYQAAAKLPLRTYTGPEDYGSLKIEYPKTWSGYVDDSGTGAALVDGYFYPNIVPSITDSSSVFALRVQVIAQAYSDTVAAFSQQQTAGQLTISAYALKQLPKVVGIELNGMLNSQQVTMVVLPLRDKTIEIWTEGTQFLSDFNNSILPNVTFSP